MDLSFVNDTLQSTLNTFSFAASTVLPFSHYSLDPTWGPKENNTFLVDCKLAKLVDADGLWFVVRDYDMVSGDDSLGQMHIKANDLLVGPDAPPKTFERKVNPPKGHSGDCGYLTIRCRYATPEDVLSIEKGEKKSYF